MASGEEKQSEGMGMGESLRRELAFAVKNIQWSYAIFWSISSNQTGVLEWGEGYYNGDIKTRKTVQTVGGLKADELGLQRTEQLRELFKSLSAAEKKNSQARRPSTALSPEDLTDTEWYFVVCMSFVFNLSQGLPGRTLANNKTIWLCNAHQADSMVFSRTLLAKSASIQTVVCFPCLGGVIELGTTEKVMEDHRIIQPIRSSFHRNFSKIPRKPQDNVACTNLEHVIIHETLHQVEEFEACSPNNSLDGVEQFQQAESLIVGSRNSGDSPVQSSSDSITQNLPMSPTNFVKRNSFDFRGDDIHYQGILKTLFSNTRELILGPRFRKRNKESSFVSWRKDRLFSCKQKHDRNLVGGSQVVLKKVLFDVAKMHGKCLVNSVEKNVRSNRVCIPESDETEASNVLAERRRREKMNHRFSVLGSLLPSTGLKVDKVSLLDGTIEYLKELERRVDELESSREATDKERRTRKKPHDVKETTTSSEKQLLNKRKKTCGRAIQKDESTGTVSVSINEKKVSIEIRCPWRENLLIEVMGAASNLHLATYSVQSSSVDGILSLTIGSKLKSSTETSGKMIKQELERICRLA